MPRFQPEAILRVLLRHRVDFVLIGGVAATLHGSNLRTGDLDICPARDPANLERLAGAESSSTSTGSPFRSPPWRT